MTEKRLTLSLTGTTHEVAVGADVQGELVVRWLKGDTASRRVRVLNPGPQARLLVDGRVVSCLVERQARDGAFAARDAEGVFSLGARPVEAEQRRSFVSELVAPMPGRIVALRVSVGDRVHVDQPLLVMEAMKMQNELVAASAATVQEVFVSEGQRVERGARLLRLG